MDRLSAADIPATALKAPSLSDPGRTEESRPIKKYTERHDSAALPDRFDSTLRSRGLHLQQRPPSPIVPVSRIGGVPNDCRRRNGTGAGCAGSVFGTPGGNQAKAPRDLRSR